MLNQAIKQAAGFQQILRKCRKAEHFEAIEQSTSPIPQLFEALEIWNKGEMLRAEIEARILADEDPAAIASKAGVETQVIELFEVYFCDLRSRLEIPGIITHIALEQQLQRDLDPKDYPKLWKHLGYASRSGHVVDQLIHGRVLSADPQAAKEVLTFFRQDAWDTLAMRAAIAMRTLPMENPRVAVQVMKMWVRLEEIQARSKRREKSPHVDITPNVEAFFGELKRMFVPAHELETLFRPTHAAVASNS